ncbi:hypothetical protein [Amycolatopsis sp. BJA-103]|nr:hypothetical protein [Amycolatopsis sp. BJA-103]
MPEHVAIATAAGTATTIGSPWTMSTSTKHAINPKLINLNA